MRQLVVYLVLAVYFNVCICSVQTKRTDSLFKEPKTFKDEELFTKANDLVILYLDINTSKSNELIDNIVNSVEIKKFPNQIARAYYVKGRSLAIQ